MDDFLKLLKNKNFIYLWVSAAIDQITVNMMSFLILIRLFEKTGSTIATSLVWVAYALPAVIIGPFGAVSADIMDRRKILMIANFAQAIVVLIYSLLFERYFYLAYGAVLIYSSFSQFYVPAESATLPRIVKKELLPTANGILFISVQTGIVTGFVLAGLLYDLLGFGPTLLLTSMLLFIAFISVSFLPKVVPRHAHVGFEKGLKLFVDEIVEGYNFIRSKKKILYPFLLLIGLQVSLSIIVILIPVIAREIVLVRANLASIVIVVPAALGAVTATALMSKILKRFKKKFEVILVSLTILSVSLFSLSVFVPILPFWIGRTLAVFCFGFAGFAYVGSLIPALTALQENTPGGLMGRVLGNIWFISAAATVFPVLFAATVSEIFGIKQMLFVISLVGLILVLVIRYSMHMRSLLSILRSYYYEKF